MIPRKPLKRSVASKNRLRPSGIKRKPKGTPKRQTKANKTKLKSISKLIKEADRLFSLQVRQAKRLCGTPENREYAACFTCGHIYLWRKLHCGHYLSRYYKAARWHPDNARPQCMMCNMWKRGDPIVFRRNLINEIGTERVEAVEALRDAPIKLSREFLEAKIKELQAI